MSAIKEMLYDKQQEFAAFKFIKDGCSSDAEDESWDSMVEHLFDGDDDAAWNEFQIWVVM